MAEDTAVPSRRAQVARLRHVAVAALADYGLPDGRLTFVTHGENTTFRHESAAGRHLVRVHRPQRHGRVADPDAFIRSELTWLRAIDAQTDVRVPRPVVALGGADTVTASARGISRTVSVLEWVDGRIYEESARPWHLARIADAMARLHAHTDTWQPPEGFTRITWDAEAFFGNEMVYGVTPAAEVWHLFPAPLRRRLEGVRDRLEPIMAADADTALIHADLQPANAVFTPGSVVPIDFDDCGFGPRVYDVAVALWEMRDREDYPSYRDAFVDAYAARRDIDLTRLDDYIALRQVAFELWYTGMAQVNPDFHRRLDIVHDWSHEMLDAVGYP